MCGHAFYLFYCLTSTPLKSRLCFLHKYQLPAGPAQILQRAAGDHVAVGQQGLDAADILPLALGDGVEQEDASGLLPSAGQLVDGEGLVHGFGVGEDEQHGGLGEDGGLHLVETLQGPTQAGAPAVKARGAHILPEEVHVLQVKGVRLVELLGEEEDAGAVGGLVERLDEAQGKL